MVRVARLLDKKHGRGWARIVKLRRLNQSTGGFILFDDDRCGCVAAQLDANRTGSYGTYGDEMDRLFANTPFDERDALVADHGFNVGRADDALAELGVAFVGLTEAWKNEVRSRR